MLGGIFNNLLKGPRAAIRAFAIAAAAGLFALVAVVFLFSAAFVLTSDRFGQVDACLGAAALFLILAVVLGLIQAVVVRRQRRESRELAASASIAALSDPRALLIGLQIAQAIGLKRLLPLLAVAGLALAVAKGRAERERQDVGSRRRRSADAPSPPPMSDFLRGRSNRAGPGTRRESGR